MIVRWCLIDGQLMFQDVSWWVTMTVIDLLLSSKRTNNSLDIQTAAPMSCLLVLCHLRRLMGRSKGVHETNGVHRLRKHWHCCIALRCSLLLTVGCYLLTQALAVAQVCSFSSTSANILGARLKLMRHTRIVQLVRCQLACKCSTHIAASTCFQHNLFIFFCVKCRFVSFARTSNQTHGFC